MRKHQKQHTLLTSPSLLCQGIFLFILGMGINIHSDYILRQLRKPGEIIYRIPQGNVSPALQILTLPWEPVPGVSLWVTKERAQMMQSIPAGPWLLLHVPSCPTIHLRSWSEPERAREEPPGRFVITIPSVWGVWGLGSGGSRLSLGCSLSCAVWGFSREAEPIELGFPGGSMIKNPPASAGDTGAQGFDPWAWKEEMATSLTRQWQPTPVFLPGKISRTEDHGGL